MLPIRLDPFRDLGTIHREIDDIFRRTFGSFRETAEGSTLLSPPIDTYVRDNTFFVTAELPGINKDELEVKVEGHVLTIHGERKLSKETRDREYLMRESHYGAFSRQLTLPEGANTEQIHAAYEDGMLTISMPMTKKLAGGRKVMIEGPEKGKKGKDVH